MKMHKNVKKICLALALTGITLTSAAVCAMEADLTVDTRSVAVSGNNPAATVAIAVMPYKYNAGMLSVATVNENPNIYWTGINAGGEYQHIILLDEQITPGKYRVSEIIRSQSNDKVIFVIDEADYPSVISASDTERIQKLSMLISNLMPDVNTDVKTMLVNKLFTLTTGNTSYDEFTDNLALYEGLYSAKKGFIDFSVYMNEYSQYISTEMKEEYNSLTKAQSDAAKNALSAIECGTKSADKVIEETMLIAKAKSSLSFSQLREYVTEYFAKNNITPSGYAALSDYHKDNVYIALFNERTSITNAENLLSRIESLVSAQKTPAPNNPGGGGGGGSSSGKTPVSGGGISAPSAGEISAPSVFNDMSSHWAKESVEQMYELDIISGFDDGSFRPDTRVTRAEFVKMLINTLSYPIVQNSGFDDVPTDAWHYGYISTAVERGIVRGISSSNFGPDMNVTREDAAVMVYRAISENVAFGSAIIYNDEKDIAEYAREAVMALSEADILKGSDGSFRPKNNMTRAEAATLLLRVRKMASGGEQ